MNTLNSEEKLTVGIIGGGKAGLQLFNLFYNSSRTKLCYVCDINPEAPAIQAARQARIPVFTSIDQALDSTPTDFIFEVTGSAEIVKALISKLKGSLLKLVTHQMAQIILSVVEENNTTRQNEVSQDIQGIKDQIDSSLSNVSNLVGNVKEITSDMLMLALNARIEAARVGEQGKGFAVVAQQMASSVDSVRNIAQEIEKINANIQIVSRQIDQSLEKLK